MAKRAKKTSNFKEVGKIETDTERWFKKEGEKVLKRLVLKPDGLLSVYPEHMELGEVKKEIEEVNFHFEKKYSKTLIHENRYIDTYVLNFRKYSE